MIMYIDFYQSGGSLLLQRQNAGVFPNKLQISPGYWVPVFLAAVAVVAARKNEP